MIKKEKIKIKQKKKFEDAIAEYINFLNNNVKAFQNNEVKVPPFMQVRIPADLPPVPEKMNGPKDLRGAPRITISRTTPVYAAQDMVAFIESMSVGIPGMKELFANKYDIVEKKDLRTRLRAWAGYNVAQKKKDATGTLAVPAEPGILFTLEQKKVREMVKNGEFRPQHPSVTTSNLRNAWWKNYSDVKEKEIPKIVAYVSIIRELPNAIVDNKIQLSSNNQSIIDHVGSKFFLGGIPIAKNGRELWLKNAIIDSLNSPDNSVEPMKRRKYSGWEHRAFKGKEYRGVHKKFKKFIFIFSDHLYSTMISEALNGINSTTFPDAMGSAINSMSNEPMNILILQSMLQVLLYRHENGGSLSDEGLKQLRREYAILKYNPNDEKQKKLIGAYIDPIIKVMKAKLKAMQDAQRKPTSGSKLTSNM